MCLGGSDSQPSSSTVVNTSSPPDFLEPFLKDIARTAQQQSRQPRSFFPGRTFSDQAPETELGLQLQTKRALAGSPTIGAANTNLQQTLAGDFLQNPFQDDLARSIVGAVRPSINARFTAAGRSGSGLEANTLTNAVTDRLAPLAFQNFGQERGRQLQAAQLAPGLAQSDFQDAAALSEVGGIREGFAQQGINEALNRFNFAQDEPAQRLARFSGQLGQTNFGGTTTSQSSARQPGSSTLGNIVGGAGAGLGLLSLLGVLG